MMQKSITLIIILLLTVSCQPPFIRDYAPERQPIIMTAGLSYTRAGFQSFSIKDSLHLTQTESLGGLPYFSFLQYSGELIYTTHNGRLYFTNLGEFDDTRKTQFGEGIGSAPTITGTTLLIAVNRGKTGLVAYDMLEGENLWELAGELSQSSPVVIDDLVIHATTLGAVAAYDIKTAERRWKIQIDDRILNNLAYAEDNLVVLTQNGTLRSYNPRNGNINWSLKIDDAFYASPVLNSTHIFAVSYNGVLTKIDLFKGKKMQSLKTASHIYSTPAMDDKNIYLGCADGRLIAAEISTLAEKWSQQLDGPVSTAPLVSDTEVILGTASRKIYRIDKTGGIIRQAIGLDGRPRSQPAYHGGKLYVAYEPDYIAVLADRGQP